MTTLQLRCMCFNLSTSTLLSFTLLSSKESKLILSVSVNVHNYYENLLLLKFTVTITIYLH